MIGVRTVMGGGVMRSLDSNGSEWACHTGYDFSLFSSVFVALYFILSHCFSAQRFMFFCVCVIVAMKKRERKEAHIKSL